jgi:hypothetical protein
MRLGLSLVLIAWGAAAGGAYAQPDAQFAASLAAALAPAPSKAAPAIPLRGPITEATSTDGLTWYSTVVIGGSEPTANRLDVTSTATRVTPGAVLGPLSAESLQPRGFDLRYTRGWPSAFSVAAGKYGLDVSPHATVGLGQFGRTAEAGAMVRFGKNLEESVTNRLNIREGSNFGAQSRWYVFAAASGRAVGMNMTNTEGDWRRVGLSQDNASRLIGDTQAGVGWRKGPMTASVGYFRRDVKIRQGLEGLMGAGDKPDDLVAVAFSIKPQF